MEDPNCLLCLKIIAYKKSCTSISFDHAFDSKQNAQFFNNQANETLINDVKVSRLDNFYTIYLGHGDQESQSRLSNLMCYVKIQAAEDHTLRYHLRHTFPYT